MHPDFCGLCNVGDLISRLNYPVLRQRYKYLGSLLENHLFLKMVFLRDLSQSCLAAEEKVRSKLPYSAP